MTEETIDKGRQAYEAELEKRPIYQATGKPRPKWDDLPQCVKEAWGGKASAGE